MEAATNLQFRNSNLNSKNHQKSLQQKVSSIPAFSISDYTNFGETAILPTRGLIKTPDIFTAAQGSSFAFAYFTGYSESSCGKNSREFVTS